MQLNQDGVINQYVVTDIESLNALRLAPQYLTIRIPFDKDVWNFINETLYNLTALQTLNISGNDIGAEGAVALGASLSHLTALRTLDVSNNGIRAEDAVSLSA
jgi:Ran GTPase-activating protein (RanGAP) involved in mRNA processing and transport